jgi:hypothetical protein
MRFNLDVRFPLYPAKQSTTCAVCAMGRGGNWSRKGDEFFVNPWLKAANNLIKQDYQVRTSF